MPEVPLGGIIGASERSPTNKAPTLTCALVWPHMHRRVSVCAAPYVWTTCKFVPSCVWGSCRQASSLPPHKDHLYQLLGIRHDALPLEVRAAYVEKAKSTHPDVCKAPGAEERFREVCVAYATLSDPRKRKLYDAGTSDESIEAESAQHQPQYGPAYSRRSYDLWKRDILLYMCRELGIANPYASIFRTEARASEALDAVCRMPPDFGPARKFGRDYSGLLIGLTVSSLLTGGVPLILLFSVKMLRIMDTNAEDLLRPGGISHLFRIHICQPCWSWLQKISGRT